MDRTAAMTWVLSACTTLRLRQSKTLSELVAAAMGVGRVSPAEIGRTELARLCQHLRFR